MTELLFGTQKSGRNMAGFHCNNYALSDLCNISRHNHLISNYTNDECFIMHYIYYKKLLYGKLRNALEKIV